MSQPRKGFRTRRCFGSLLLVSAVGLSACFAQDTTVRGRAAMLADKGREQEAIDLLREHLREHPDALAERRLLIRILALQGDLKAAADEAEELAQRLPSGDPTPFIELGHAHELAHKYAEALALYDRAAQAAPRDPRGPRTGGMRAARWGEAELAEPRLEEALRRDSKDARVWHALGLVRARLGDLDAAAKAYRSGLTADPRALENRLGLATLAVKRGDAAEALQHYDALIAARPRLADAHLGRSWALIGLGRLDEAEATLDRAGSLGANRQALARQRALLGRLRGSGGPKSPARAKQPQKNR